jgi:RNA polymerase sigma factor (sigma-70 family)
MLRSRGPRGTLQPLPEEPAELESAAEPSPEERIDRRRLQQAFLRLAAGLAPRQRAAFVLREVEGQETSEIAAALGVTESTVRNHLLQARRALRAGLEREYPGLVPRRTRGDGEG